MDITAVGRPVRIMRLALLGVGVALGWLVVSFVLGLSSSSALADDDSEDRRGVLGVVGAVVSSGASVVEGTVGAVSDTTGGAVETVVQVADQTLDAVPAPAVVQPAAQLLSGATGAVGAVAQEVAEQRPVTQVAEVVTTIVEHTPIIGAAAEELGLPDAVETIGGAVDDTVGDVVGSVTDAADAVVDEPEAGPDGAASTPPPSPDGDEFSEADAGGPLGAVAGSSETSDAATRAAAAASRALLLLIDDPTDPAYRPAASSASPPVFTATVWGGTSGSIGTSLPVDATISGPTGAGPGAWGLLAFGPLFAYRAWVRNRGPDDDRLPGAPVFGTDVSPD